jgi:hypothetical protein
MDGANRRDVVRRGRSVQNDQKIDVADARTVVAECDAAGQIDGLDATG